MKHWTRYIMAETIFHSKRFMRFSFAYDHAAYLSYWYDLTLYYRGLEDAE